MYLLKSMFVHVKLKGTSHCATLTAILRASLAVAVRRHFSHSDASPSVSGLEWHESNSVPKDLCGHAAVQDMYVTMSDLVVCMLNLCSNTDSSEIQTTCLDYRHPCDCIQIAQRHTPVAINRTCAKCAVRLESQFAVSRILVVLPCSLQFGPLRKALSTPCACKRFQEQRTKLCSLSKPCYRCL